MIALSKIDGNTWNPRRVRSSDLDAELEASIREKGVRVPLIVRMHPDELDRYEVVAGMRRYDVATRIGLTELPCVVTDLDTAEAREDALIENLQRQNMSHIDEALAYGALMKLDKRVYTIAKIAKRTGQPESHVYRRLKLLELDKDLQQALAEDRLSIGHAEKLLRLPPPLRKQAADPKNGVVWSRSPLLDYNEKWTPGKDDLRPLADLEKFIRNKSHFDPTSEDARHFQPDLAADLLPPVVDDDAWSSSSTTSTLVELSDDPMARMRLGAKQTDKIPLTPSKWREVKTAAARCPFTVRGVITHGGPARVLEVCTKRSCAKHWPVSKKKRSTSSTSKGKPGESSWERQAREDRERREREEKKQKAEKQLWARVWPDVKRDLIAHLKPIKITAQLFNTVLHENYEISAYSFDRVARDYGIKLADDNVALVVALTCFTDWARLDQHTKSAAAFKFNVKAYETKLQRWRAEAAKKVRAAAAPKKPAKATSGSSAKKTNAKKGKVT